MKNKINALLLSDLKIIIPNEQPRYLIEKNNNGNYIIKPIPIIYKGNIRNILDSLAYDFDSLKANNQILYNDHIKTFILNNENNYKLDTKIYKLKRK